MPRNKKRGGAANTKVHRAAREDRRSNYKSPFVESDDSDSASQPIYKEVTLAFRDARAKQMEKGSGEQVEQPSTAHEDVEESPSNARGYGPLPEDFRKHVVEQMPDMANYKMVYNQEPGTRALLLRFPNRKPDQPYNARTGQKPLEIRIKPKYGHIEVDVPILVDQHWDVEKAIEYQHAMQKSTVLQQGRSYGLAGGLGASPQAAAKKPPSEPPTVSGPSMERLLADPADANNKGHVMNKITLAGRIFPFDDTQSRYLCGVFRDDAIVELSANFSHLDALHDLNKSAARHQRNADKEDQVPEAKAVNLTVKSTEPDEDEMPGGRSEIAQLLKDMAEEPWQRMEWIDQDDEESYDRFEKHFGMDKGIDGLPELISTMTPQQWLDVMSCPRYDYTTKSYREMTFPKKGEKDPKLRPYDPRFGGYINGTTGYIDAEGWEYVDPDAPKDPRFTYEDIPRRELDHDYSST
ncbi:MAG: hypothetical protein L6R42_009697 [Xanthoria sp. 1 TBL-2021]|nr:MAG: hypothetical protein L6R42_009697 [Xanthoria sp. 1 TBL-2021]